MKIHNAFSEDDSTMPTLEVMRAISSSMETLPKILRLRNMHSRLRFASRHERKY
jgi:hypothetical protein